MSALSCRAYRLKDVSQHHSSRPTGQVREYITQIALKLAEHNFSGEDLIMAIEFLTRFVRKAGIQEVSEARRLVALSSVLKEFPSSQCEAGVEMVFAE